MEKIKTFNKNENFQLLKSVSSLLVFLEDKLNLKTNVALIPEGIKFTCNTKSEWRSPFGLGIHLVFKLILSEETATVQLCEYNKIYRIVLFFIGVAWLCDEKSAFLGFVLAALSVTGTFMLKRTVRKIFHAFDDNISKEPKECTPQKIEEFANKLSLSGICVLAEKIEKETPGDSFELYKLAAAKKSDKAFAQLGHFYYNGEVVTKDLKKAFEYWSVCERNLDADASLKFADMYRDGDVTEKDLKKAFQYYQKASKENFAQRIVEIYEQGTDLPEYLKAVASIYEERFDAGEKQILDKVIEIYTKLNDSENIQKWQIVKAKNGDTDLALCLGKKLFHENNRKAIELLEIGAQNNDPVALRMLGWIYWDGDLITQDTPKGIEYFKRAVTNGSLQAARCLVIHFQNDEANLVQALEDEINLALSEKYVDGDEDLDLPKHMFLLASYYDCGGKKGTPDKSKAIELYEKSIEYGGTEGYLPLAILYCDENADFDRAIACCQKAVEAGIEDAEELLKECQIIKAKNGDIDLALELGKKLYEEGNAKSVELLEMAISQNDPIALRMLGEAYWFGDLVTENNERAVKYFQKAAENGSLSAAESLVAHYTEEEKDELKQLKFLEQEIALFESGKYVDKDEDFILADELYELAWLYCSGGEEGVIPRNVSKGIELFLKAIELGDTDSYLSLAEIYSEEEYGTVDYDKAIMYCKKAVEANVEDAEEWLKDIRAEQKNANKQAEFQNMLQCYKDDQTGEVSLKLAKAYEHGKGVKKDISKAVSFFQDSAEKYNAESVFHLGRVAENGIDMEGDIEQSLMLYDLAFKLGYDPAFDALENLKAQLEQCRSGLANLYSEEKKNLGLDGMSEIKCIAFARYFTLTSYFLGGAFYGWQKKNCKQNNFAEYFRESEDPLELSLGLMDVLYETKKDEDAWYYLERLITRNIYWPISYLASTLHLQFNEEPDKEPDETLMEIFIICCAGSTIEGCLEPIGLCSRYSIDVKKLKKAWQQLKPNLVTTLKDCFDDEFPIITL